jgi:hypothetical protein
MNKYDFYLINFDCSHSLKSPSGQFGSSALNELERIREYDNAAKCSSLTVYGGNDSDEKK